MAGLSIATLGSLRIVFEGEPIRGFRTDKERALLVYLAVEGDRPHRRETLAGMFWPEVPESNARHTLSQALTGLRHVLGDRDRPTPYLEATRSTVGLSAAHRIWLDVREFDTLIPPSRPIRGPEASRPSLKEGTIERLGQAVTLYQGGFLSGFSLGDAPAFEEWQLLHRERLHRRAIEALALLVEQAIAAGDYQAALGFAWRQVELDPWREAAQREVIRLLAFTGQRGAALRQVDICTGILMEELGVEPDEQTRALARAVRAGTLEGAGSSADKGPPPVVIEREELLQIMPTSLIPLIGREAEMAQLDRYLQDPGVRLLTLVGPGGIGKTRLAQELAGMHAESFVDGVYVVPLVATTSWEVWVAAMAQSVGFVASAGSGSMEQQMLRFLHGKLVLLILDNVEQLVDHAPRLVQMLESAPNVRVIATSRVRLGILGEVTFPVEALAVPNEGGRDLAALSETGSVKLFVYSAQRVVHDFRLSEANAADVVGICRRVEGMPLALLLAAAWSDVLSPAEILDRLTGEVLHEGDRPIDFLSAEWSDVPSRQRSMRAVFDHSWHLMRDYEQTVLQALAVFRGGFSAEAAYFVVGATLRQIRRLVEQSLLGRLTGGRYGIHELLRQYVAEHLARVPAVERQVRDRHADYYVHLLHRWFEDAKGPRQVAALAEMDGEIDNAQAAWDWIVGQGDVAQIVQAVDGLCLYYLRRVRGEEMVYACRAVLARLDGSRLPDAVTEAQRLKVVARLLVWQSEIVSDAEAGEAVDSAQAALSSPALSGVDVRVERGRALRLQADLLLNTDRRRSLALYREALGVLREVGDRWEASRVLYSLVTLTLRLADFAATQEYSEDLRRIGRSLGDLHALAYALEGLSNIALYEGRLEEASRIAEEGLDVRRELGVPLMIGVGLETLALRRLLSGRLDLALPLYDESLAIQDRLGLPAPYPRGVKAWGFMLAGDYDEARALVQRALDESHLTGERRLIAWNEQVVGSLTFVTGAVEDALEWLVHSADEFRALREPAFLGMGLSFLGYAHRAAGDRDRARACYVEALHMGVKSGVSPILACALPGMAMLYADAGRAERAQALITVVTQCCLFVVASKWFADVAGPEYRHAMAALSSEQVSEAEQSVLLSDMRTEALAVLVEVEAGTAP